jgi:uncharacterized protein (DUF1697 family)
VNVGTAGTFVIPNTIGAVTLRAEMMRRLPVDTDMMICDGRDIVRLTSGDPYRHQPSGPGIVQFVSVLARRRPSPRVPLNLPSDDDWCLRIIRCDGRFVFGVHRREMKAIRYLRQLDTIFGVPVTTRSWRTMVTIARIVSDTDRRGAS